jgi:hypothetical protein
VIEVGRACARAGNRKGHGMKAHEALIAWTPRDSGNPTAGQVKVGRLLRDGEGDWTDPFSFTGGAAYMRVRSLRGPESVSQLFIDFHTMVVRDGIDPQVAHRAFLVIDDYAERIAADIDGSRGQPIFW